MLLGVLELIGVLVALAPLPISTMYAQASERRQWGYSGHSPVDGSTANARYALMIAVAADNQSYTLAATPAGGRAADGAIPLLSDGTRRWDADNSGAYSAQ